MEDSWVWKYGDFSTYSVNSAYVSLRGELEGENTSVYENFWRIKAFPSAHVTSWKVLENNVATKANLERRGVAVKSSMCIMCGVKEE